MERKNSILFNVSLSFVVITIILGAVQPAYAQDALPGFYGSDRDGDIFLFDPTIPSITPLGSTGIGSTEIECTTDGLFCFSQQRDGSFTITEVSFNPPSTVGPPAVAGVAFNGLEYVGNTLYGTWIDSPCTPSTLAILNPVTGAFVNIGPTNTGRPMSGLAFDTANNIMYGVDGCNAVGTSSLWTVNLVTGNAAPVGNTLVNLGSLEFGPDGNLYAGGDTSDGGNLYELNPVTGSSSLVVSSGFSQVTGLTLVDDVAVGGMDVSINTSALLLAGVESISMWMIPVVIAGAGIGLFVIKRRK